MVRVRFAPSPTGALHLGGARTAIYNWLFARSQGGSFLVRIEDTDQERSQSHYVDQICRSLRWLGLDWDEPLVYQSARLTTYQTMVQQLIGEGHAYRCFCSDDELENQRQSSGDAFRYSGKCRALSHHQIAQLLRDNRPFAVRFKTDPGKIEWNDGVYGPISVENSEIDDFILLRRNGRPTYQLAVVADDIRMGITHIIRGQDHVSNTPKQILLYRALGAPLPQFVHLPLLIGTDGKRLSKRHGATGVDEYRDQGYPAEAIFNYLALLGWIPADNQEVRTPSGIIEQFRIEQIARKAAVFDQRKLNWISGEHIGRMDNHRILVAVAPFLIEAAMIAPGEIDNRQIFLLRFIELMKSRMQTFDQFASLGSYFFRDPEGYDTKAAIKYWPTTATNQLLEILYERFSNLDQFAASETENELRQCAERQGVAAAKLIHPLRLAVTGFGVSPGIFEVLELLGKETILRRIREAITRLPLGKQVSQV